MTDKHRSRTIKSSATTGKATRAQIKKAVKKLKGNQMTETEILKRKMTVLDTALQNLIVIMADCATPTQEENLQMLAFSLHATMAELEALES